MREKATALVIIIFALGAAARGQGGSKALIVNSRHDFSVTSGSATRSMTETTTCVFCHTPHAATPNVPLWNHTATTGSSPQVYTSTTLRSTLTQATINDASKLCLSCHDGTVALGDTVNNGLIPFVQGTDYKLPASAAANLDKGVGFADDHPFAFLPTTGAEIRTPPAGDPVRLDAAGKMQCASCHNPHNPNGDATVGKFLVKSNLRSALCLTCHTKAGWDAASHRQPASSVNDGRYGPVQGAHTGYTGVSSNACESCHRPHSPAVGQRLLKFLEEDTCFKCHNGSVADAGRNIQAEFQTKAYRHPVNTTPSAHDASEGPASASFRLPETSAGAARHAECADCHNPHAANATTAAPPAAAGYQNKVRGITSSGAAISAALYQYEVCLKCHGDSANKPQFNDVGTTGVGYGRNPRRLTDQANPNRYNVRFEFNSTVAWHPVLTPRGLPTGSGGEAPSLRAAPMGLNGQPIPGRTLSASSQIYCSDCHSNDTGRNTLTGTGPVGPHGSNVVHLLERNYSYNSPPAVPGGTMGRVSYSSNAYALCNKCHDISGSTLQDVSFKEHDRHIVDAGASCSVCHDAHGINGGNTTNNSHLINFDLSIVGPEPDTGRLKYERTGFRAGRCYLMCHGKEHSPREYHQ
jgi:predicted CXXCH cytochrome family protein